MWCGHVMTVLIIASLLPLCFKEYSPVLETIEYACVLVFIADYLARWATADLKLGKGGLSDVEWTVQLMQLQHAGDIKDLRVNGTLEALDVLEAKKLISAIDAIQLRKAWTLCTAARNGSYLWSGRANQADILPDDIYSLGGIAVYLGYGAHRGQHFENDLLAVMRKCRDVCQRLFYGKTEGEAAAATTATASAATQQPQTAPRPRMHVIAPRLERNRRRAQR